MSLHRIYHSSDVFSIENKRELAENITELYRIIGIPQFYVNIIFIPIEKHSFFVGGQSKDTHIRIIIQHFASQLHNDEVRKIFVQKYEKILSSFLEQKGYDWEINLEDISNSIWKLNGLTPPLPNTWTEEDWIRYKKIILYD